MPRPSVDIVAQLISDLTGYVKDSSNTAVDVRARYVVSQVKAPLVTVGKIGEWSNVISVDGSTKASYGDYVIDVWAGDYDNLKSMRESLMSRLKDLRKAYQTYNIIFLVDMTVRFIPEPDIVPIIYHEQVIVRCWWFE
jgi:hypothetical protein